MVLRAMALFLSAKFSDALAQLTAVLKSDPDNRRANVLRSRIRDVERLKEEGKSLFNTGLCDAAILKWNDALQVRFVFYHPL